MLQWLIVGAMVLIGSVGLIGFWLLRKPEVIEDKGESAEPCFSSERYEPMKRLLSPEDLEFLRLRPGISPKAIRKLEQNRYRIFRSYLKELAADFEGLHSQARLLVAGAPEEYAPLVHVIMKQQVRFRLALAGVHCRLALHQAGLGDVDLNGVFQPVQALQQVLDQAA